MLTKSLENNDLTLVVFVEKHYNEKKLKNVYIWPIIHNMVIDKELWVKVKADDKKAFELVFNKYYGSLCLYAFDLLKDEDTAEEVVADVFLKLWQKRSQIDIEFSLKPYFFRCVRNACLDYLEANKSVKYLKNVEISEKIKEMTLVEADSIVDNLSFDVMEKEVLDAIDQLPPQCRQIFCLNRFQLLTYNEISQKLDISVNTVKTQIGRALDMLRKQLKHYL